jgi:hypothetical protein
MVVGHAKPFDQASLQPQTKDDVVAAVEAAGVQNGPNSPACIVPCLQEELLLVIQAEEELPPYDIVPAQEFVFQNDDMEGCARGNETCRFLYQRSPESMRGCSLQLPRADFILFPNDSDYSSQDDSSAVSCFTHDSSHSSNCTGTSSRRSSTDLPVRRPQALVTSTLQPCCYQGHQAVPHPGVKVAEWLCKTGQIVEHAPLSDLLEQVREIDADKDAAELTQSAHTPKPAA